MSCAPDAPGALSLAEIADHASATDFCNRAAPGRERYPLQAARPVGSQSAIRPERTSPNFRITVASPKSPAAAVARTRRRRNLPAASTVAPSNPQVRSGKDFTGIVDRGLLGVSSCKPAWFQDNYDLPSQACDCEYSPTGINAERFELIDRSFLTFLSEKAPQAA